MRVRHYMYKRTDMHACFFAPVLVECGVIRMLNNVTVERNEVLRLIRRITSVSVTPTIDGLCAVFACCYCCVAVVIVFCFRAGFDMLICMMILPYKRCDSGSSATALECVRVAWEFLCVCILAVPCDRCVFNGTSMNEAQTNRTATTTHWSEREVSFNRSIHFLTIHLVAVLGE